MMHETQGVLQEPAKKLSIERRKKKDATAEARNSQRDCIRAADRNDRSKTPPTPPRLGNAKRLAVRVPRQLPHRNRRRNPMSQLGQGRDCFGVFGKDRNKI